MDQNNNRSPVKKSEMTRKKRKPLMEKRRRARINASLEQLKKLVLDATRRDSARYSKLEKADILELTVRHLHEVQRNNINYAVHQDPTVLHKFGDGFGECINEVNRYLSNIEGFSPDAQRRLMEHLSGCVQKVYTPQPANRRPEDFPPTLRHSPKQQPNLAPLQALGFAPHGGPQQSPPGALFHHSFPLTSPTATPSVSPQRTLPVHNALISPPLSPATQMHECIMLQNHRQAVEVPRTVQSHLPVECLQRSRRRNNEFTSGRTLERDLSGEGRTGYQLVTVKREDRKNLAIKAENDVLSRPGHGMLLDSVHFIREEVWRPW